MGISSNEVKIDVDSGYFASFGAGISIHVIKCVRDILGRKIMVRRMLFKIDAK